MAKEHDELSLYGSSILHTPCVKIDCNTTSSESLLELIRHMSSAMNMHNGVGLAANQIGRSESVFIAKTETSEIQCFINPTIVFKSEEVDLMDEGCLSIPGVFSKIQRHRVIRLQWCDEKLQLHEREFDGLMAQIIQHEVDHLNGKTYVDHFKPLKKQLLIDKHKKYLKSLNKSRFNRS
jgi:peptide deformylase